MPFYPLQPHHETKQSKSRCIKNPKFHVMLSSISARSKPQNVNTVKSRFWALAPPNIQTRPVASIRNGHLRTAWWWRTHERLFGTVENSNGFRLEFVTSGGWGEAGICAGPVSRYLLSRLRKVVCCDEVK